MKKIIMAAVAVFVLSLAVSAFDAVHGEKYYTVKVMGAYKSGAAKCRQMCQSLQKDGVMAFCVKGGRINGTFAGIYASREAAVTAAAGLKAKYGIPCIAEETKAVSAVKYGEGFIVNVPSGIWIEKAGEVKKVFDYGRCVDARMSVMENKIDVSHSGREIVFFYNGAIHKVELGTGKDTVLVSGLANPGAPCRPSPKWAPDGKTIAFVEEYGADKGAGIKIMKKDGTGMKTLLDNRNAGKHVASIAWRPGTELLYYIETGTNKRVTVGGNLYAIDMSGKVTLKASPLAGKEIDRHFEFSGGSIIIAENAYTWGLDDKYTSLAKKLDLN